MTAYLLPSKLTWFTRNVTKQHSDD